MGALINLHHECNFYSILQKSSLRQGLHSIMIQVIHEGVVPVAPLVDGWAGVGLMVREENHTPLGNRLSF